MKLEGHYVNVIIGGWGLVLHSHEDAVGQAGGPVAVAVDWRGGHAGFVGAGRIEVAGLPLLDSDFRGALQALDLDCVILVQGIEVFGSGAGHQQQGRALLLCGGSQYGDGAEGESQQHQQVVQWPEKRHSSSYSPDYVFRLFPREGRFAPWSLIVYFFYARVIVVLGYSASTKLKM